MAIGDIGQWRHTAGASPGTSWVALVLGAEDRNDDSNYSLSSTQVTLPEGRFFLTYQVAWVASAIANRGNVEVSIYKNGTIVKGSYGSGYQRDAANDAAWAAGSLMVESDGNDYIEIFHRRDTGTSVGTYDSNRSFLDVVQVPDDTAFSIYSDGTDTDAGDDTALTAVALDTSDVESDNSVISRSGSTVTLKASTAYLISYGVGEYNSAGSRIARLSDLYINSASVPGSMGFAYLRDASNQYGCPNGTAVYKTGASSETLQIRVCRGLTISPGTAYAGGTLTAGTRSIQILELPSSAEVYTSHDGTGGQIVSTGDTTVEMTLFLNEDETDTGLISKTSSSEIAMAKDADMLLMAGIYIRRTGLSGTRLTREGTWSINSVESSHGTNGNYNRGDQSSQDVYDSSHNPRGIFSLSDGDDINVNMSKSWDTGWNDGGGDAQTNTAIESGFFALNLDSLSSSATNYTIEANGGSITTTGTATDLYREIEISANSGAYSSTGYDVALDYGVSYTLTADAGTVGATGQAVELLRTYLVDTEGGEAEITGISTDLSKALLISTGSGVHLLTGQDARLGYGSDQTLSAESGSFSIAGTDSILSRTYGILCDTGIHSTTGDDAGLTRIAFIMADGDSLTSTGAPSTLHATRGIEAETAEIVTTGIESELIRRAFIASTSGEYHTIGGAAELTYIIDFYDIAYINGATTSLNNVTAGVTGTNAATCDILSIGAISATSESKSVVTADTKQTEEITGVIL